MLFVVTWSNPGMWTRVEKAAAGSPAQAPRVSVCGFQSHGGGREEFLRL